MANFNKLAFDATFKKSVGKLRSTEKTTRELIRELSRSVLTATHETGSIDYMNGVLDAVTPVNARGLVHYFAEFTGYHHEKGRFTKKDKKSYQNARNACDKFLEDPNNNFWAWQERKLEIVPAPKRSLDELVTEAATKWHSRCVKEGIPEHKVLIALFKGGISPECVVNALDEMGFEFGAVAE